MFEGHQQPIHERVVTSQKCIRTNDIDSVGKSKRHLTGFTMLGHFSFGDYFKQESICLGYKLVTKIYGINSNNLIITVHPDDQETQEIWSKYLPSRNMMLRVKASVVNTVYSLVWQVNLRSKFCRHRLQA